MLLLKILAIIALILFLIGLIPVGADVSYEANQLSVSAKVCGICLKLFPKSKEGKKERKKKEKKEKKKPEKDEAGAEKKKKKFSLSFNFEEIMALIEKALHGLSKFRRFSIDRFKLDLVYTGKDPYSTAVQFAYINALLSSIGPIFAEKTRNSDCFVRTDIDFSLETIQLDAALGVSIKIWQIFSVVNTILFGAIGILIKNKLRLMKESKANKKALTKQAEEPSVNNNN